MQDEGRRMPNIGSFRPVDRGFHAEQYGAWCAHGATPGGSKPGNIPIKTGQLIESMFMDLCTGSTGVEACLRANAVKFFSMYYFKFADAFSCW